MATVPTETITQQRQTLNLNLGALKTVTWLETNPVVEDVTSFTKRQCDRAREYTVIGWIFALVQFQLLWLYTLLHTIPWPSWVIGAVHRADDAVEWALETAFRKLEWWWDYLSVHLMRAVETTIVYLDKFITFIDHVIEWIMIKYQWVWEATTSVVAVAVSVWNWYIGLWTSAWAYLMNLVNGVKSAWEGSQEEMLTIQEQQQKKQLHDRQQQHQLRQLQQQQRQREQVLGPQSGQGQLMHPQPYDADEQEYCCDGSVEGSVTGWSSRGDLVARRMSRIVSSDSESSEVTGVHETSTLLMGEQTGRSYKRVHTEATVVGQRRQAMYHRVSAKLKVMRKNSIRFSRGMDVRVSQFIGSAQKKFTPRSLVSMILSLVQFVILAPFRVVMWLVGGKRLSRRSRSMRSESIRRREAAAAAATAEGLLARPLGPAALLQSAEPVQEMNEKTVLPAKLEDPASYLNSIRHDSGVSEGVPDSSEESNGLNASAVATIRKIISPNVSHQSRQEKCLSMSSTSTISEEPDEDGHISNSPTPPPTPRDHSPTRSGFRDTAIHVASRAAETYRGPPPLRPKHTSVSEAVEVVSSPILATSEPDLRQTSILVNGNHGSPDYKRRSIGATLDEYSQTQAKKPKKRVTIQ